MSDFSEIFFPRGTTLSFLSLLISYTPLRYVTFVHVVYILFISLPTIVSNIAQFSGGLAMMFIISWRLALVCLLFVLASLFIIYQYLFFTMHKLINILQVVVAPVPLMTILFKYYGEYVNRISVQMQDALADAASAAGNPPPYFLFFFPSLIPSLLLLHLFSPAAFFFLSLHFSLLNRLTYNAAETLFNIRTVRWLSGEDREVS